MNLKVITYLLTCSTILLISCNSDKPQRPDSILKEDATKGEILTDPIKAEMEKEMRKKSKAVDIPAARVQALSILEYRAKKDTNSYAIIEADTWEYKFVYDGGMSKPGEYDGVWIDFYPDGTYEYGKYDEVQGGGKYSYHFDRSELLMLDNDSSIKPQEWNVKNAGDAMVLVGTATYRDNSVQMKLERVKESIKSTAN